MKHMPYFITNDVMGIMYLLLGISGACFAFWKIYNNSLIPVIPFIVYVIGFIIFCLIYGFELWTNEEVKRLARNYYHTAYDFHKENSNDWSGFDEEFDKRFKRDFFRGIFRK